MNLLWNLIYNDIRKNKIISIVLTLFLLLSAILMAGGLRVMGIMMSSTSGLNKLASPPDYFQMHKGEYDKEAVKKFADSHAYIRDSQVISMLNIANANIFYNGETLEKCLMDNGFVVQSKGFDYLLDTDNQVAKIHCGEVGVPVYYNEELGIRVGDVLTITDGSFTKNLQVVTLIRDAQMNAPLTSSKRFLISEEDLLEISTYTGEWEYSIEYMLQDGADVTILQSDYLNAGLPSNGVAISIALLNLLNSVSYGLTAILLLVISFILIFIALLCLSYIIRATLAEEHRTIGTMKAMGFSVEAIEKLYLMKYMTLSIISGIVGYFLAIPFGNFCSASVLLYCGKGLTNWMQWIFPIIGIVLLELLVVLRCKRMIKKNLKSTVVELMRDCDDKKREGRYRLPQNRRINKNIMVALGELSCKWKEYMVLFFVFVFAAFMIILPINMKDTVQDESFITYMGIGRCDIRIDIQKGSDMEEQREALLKAQKIDNEIEQFAVFQNGYVQVKNAEGNWEYLRISSGDESVFPIQYVEGIAPNVNLSKTKEMALSYMEANALGLQVGDKITVKQGENIEDFTLSGIYQDITYSGKTGKAPLSFEKDSLEGYVFYIKVKDGVSIEQKAGWLREIVTGSRVTPIDEFVKQTLGGIISNIGTVIIASTILSLALIILITTMFLQLITAREHSTIANKKAIGFTNTDIRIQLGIRIFIIQLIAILFGAVLTNTLGEGLFGLFLSSFGVVKIKLLINPLVVNYICPVLELFVCVLTIMVATKVVKKYHIRDQIME